MFILQIISILYQIGISLASEYKVNKKHWNWFRKNDILIDADISWSKVVDHQGYKISYYLVDYIIKNYGKEAVIELLKIRRDSKDKDLEKKMARILCGDLNNSPYALDFCRNPSKPLFKPKSILRKNIYSKIKMAYLKECVKTVRNMS